MWHQLVMTSNQWVESRGDVEMGNEEDEEPLEAVGPRARMNPKTPHESRVTRT